MKTMNCNRYDSQEIKEDIAFDHFVIFLISVASETPWYVLLLLLLAEMGELE